MAQRRSRASINPNRTEGPALAGHAVWLAKATLQLMETVGPALDDDQAKLMAEHVRGMAENLVRITQIVNDLEDRLAGTEEEAEAPRIHAASVHARNVADQVKMFAGTLHRKGAKERASESSSEHSPEEED